MVDLRRVNFNFVDVRVEVGIRIRTSTCDSLSPFVGTPPQLGRQRMSTMETDCPRCSQLSDQGLLKTRQDICESDACATRCHSASVSDEYVRQL